MNILSSLASSLSSPSWSSVAHRFLVFIFDGFNIASWAFRFLHKPFTIVSIEIADNFVSLCRKLVEITRKQDKKRRCYCRRQRKKTVIDWNNFSSLTIIIWGNARSVDDRKWKCLWFSQWLHLFGTVRCTTSIDAAWRLPNAIWFHNGRWIFDTDDCGTSKTRFECCTTFVEEFVSHSATNVCTTRNWRWVFVFRFVLLSFLVFV